MRHGAPVGTHMWHGARTRHTSRRQRSARRDNEGATTVSVGEASGMAWQGDNDGAVVASARARAWQAARAARRGERWVVHVVHSGRGAWWFWREREIDANMGLNGETWAWVPYFLDVVGGATAVT
jgi:hypothetical protein